MTIVSIRATHGAGKSTICRKIIDKYNGSYVFGNKVTRRGDPVILGYHMLTPAGDLFIPGRYDIACGGCDAIQPYGDIWPLIAQYAERGYHVLFEGALVSSSYGTIGAAMQEWQDRTGTPGVFAFLDTPLDTCLARIAERRKAKGNFDPVDPRNTTVKFDNVHRTKEQMARLGSTLRIVDIDHREPVKAVMRLYGVRLNKEPA